MENDRCHVEPLDKPLDESKLATAMAAYLAVGGMGCPRCAQRVRNGLLGLEGVLLADVFLEQGLAAAAYDPQQLSPDDLVGAVAGAGNPSISSGHSDGRHHYWAELLAVMPATEALAD
ncbi:MAG: heavy-metal-associated domain-containing protein [Anaerolineae bacterium]